MSAKRHTEEFKVEADKQVTERSHPVAEVNQWMQGRNETFIIKPRSAR